MKQSELQFFAPTPRQRELQILMEIDRDPQVSQKELALRVGLAPSMVNNYMKQLCDEEKVQKCGPNHKRITYHLTEEGKRMKEDLLARYLTEGLRLYQTLSEDLKRRLRNIQQEGISSVVLLGAEEACDAIRKAAGEVGLEVLGTEEAAADACKGKMTIGGGSHAPRHRPQAVLVTDTDTEESRSRVLETFKQQGLPIYHV
ncbi:MAG TPA: winged helix-turn-helix transcriptional regulator [Candidatus Polarisedimenticolia bacterium]|jgi:DNA-binding MarR family transcriptional regulator